MNLPQAFIDRTRQLLGETTYASFEEALGIETPVSIRPNRTKTDKPVVGEAVPWASSVGFYLENRPTFTFDPLFHAGCYYVQEASSMFVERVLREYVHEPVVMLDLCAAPGGKSTLCRSVLPEGSLLVANEVMRNRSQILAENLIKWGHPEVVVTNNDPADFTDLTHLFDVILTDVPCSGEGMFRKDARAVEMWSPANVRNCVTRQHTILTDIWEALRPGGLLVYSTCTFNVHEDEEMVAWIRDELGAEVLPIDIDPEWGITGNLTENKFPVYRFIPGHTRGEGFFLALLRKDGDSPVAQPRPQRSRPTPLPKACAEAKKWLTSPEEYEFVVEGENIIALPRKHQTAMAALQAKLKVLHCGVPVAAIKNNKLIPLHPLAMSNALNREAFATVEVTHEQALAYLHREALSMPSAPTGILLFTYKDTPLGFAKNVGNRVNNLYPAEWRIRKDPVEL